MKKKPVMMLLLLCVLLVAVLSACGCRHEWTEATCDAPKTCSKCEAVEGEALGHGWMDATCERPSLCRRCGETEGEALAHTWVEATCEAPKTCSVCSATEGEALSHNWTVPNCQEPQTCTACGASVGEAGEHVWVEATCQAPKTCSVCSATEGEPVGHAEGESEIVSADFVDATGVYDTYCATCSEVMSSETMPLPYLHVDGYFLFSAAEYAERIHNIFSQDTNLYSTLYINEDMNNAISCDMISREDGNDFYAYTFFYDGDYELVDTDSDKQYYFSELWTILDCVSADDTMDASNTMLAILMAADPTLDKDAATDIALELTESGATTHNGIDYTLEVYDVEDAVLLFTAIAGA